MKLYKDMWEPKLLRRNLEQQRANIEFEYERATHAYKSRLDELNTEIAQLEHWMASPPVDA